MDEIQRDYDNLTKCLCADCAIEAIENMDGDVYFEYCDNCGKKYNPFAALNDFQAKYYWDSGATIDDLFCFDCAVERREKEEEESEKYI